MFVLAACSSAVSGKQVFWQEPVKEYLKSNITTFGGIWFLMSGCRISMSLQREKLQDLSSDQK